MATITRTVNGKRVTTNVGESISEFSKRLSSRRVARRQAEQIRRSGGSAFVETIGDKVVVVQVKAPEIVEEVSRRKTDRGVEITGFTRADVVKREALRDQDRVQEQKLKKLQDFSIKQSIIKNLPSTQKIGIFLKKQDTFVGPKKTERVEPTTKQVQDIIERTGRGEFRGQLIKINEFTAGDISIPSETKVQTVVRRIASIEKSVADKIGTQKVNTALKKFNEKRFGGEKNIPFSEKVSQNIVTNILEKPISNAILLGASAGVSKGIQVVGLNYTKLLGKLSKTAPKLAKKLGYTEKVFRIGGGAVIGTVYAGSVINEGLQEKKNTGKIDKTTANAIRELMLFSIGSRIGTSVKTQKLTQLQAEFNKLSSEQQKSLQNRLNKISLASPNEFKAKELGLTKQLDSLQLKKNIVNGRIKEDVLLVTKDKLFFVKKGNIPKKTQSFFVDVVGVKSTIKKGIQVVGSFKTKYKVKYNSRTGKLVPIGKPLQFEVLNNVEANNLIKKYNVGKIIKTKTVLVKGFEKKAGKKAIELLPEFTLTKKKVSVELVAKKIKVGTKIKPSKRKINEILEAKLKTSKSKTVSVEGKQLEFLQFTPTKKITKPKKVAPSIKPEEKFDEFVIIGEQGFLRAKKVETVTKPVSKTKPVIETIKFGKQEAKVLPLITPQTKTVKPSVKAKKISVSRTVSKVRLIVLPKTLRKQIGEPKSKVLIKAKQVSDSRRKSKIKPVIKLKSVPAIKQRIISEQIEVSKPKISIKSIVAQRKNKTFKPLKQIFLKKPSIKIPKIFNFGKKPLTKKLKFGKQKPQKVFFTTTILRPKKKAKGVKFGEYELFTGAELR